MAIQDGWDFFVLEVNRNWIFRFPRRQEGLSQLEKENRFLSEWSYRLPVPVPRYRWIYLQATPSFAAYPKLSGLALNPRSIPEDSRNCAQELALFLSSLHRIPIPSPREVHIQNWKLKYEKFHTQVQRQLLHRLEEGGRVEELVPLLIGISQKRVR
ncbi:phosphotransferase [Marinithermofilum abyssi]